MLKVIIAEKPSVARNIAEAIDAKQRRDGFFEGANYIVTWAFGHLLELYDSKDYDEKMGSWRMENFPFIPEAFKYKVKHDNMDRKQVDLGAQKQIETIRSLIDRADVEGVISACDYDREGQIIGDIILEYLDVQKPIERLLLNEWTADEVLGGLKKLVSNTQMSPLRDAGISRQWADWIIGINLTSVATLKYQRGSAKALNIGRVLLPTLKIIYDRDMEIENFVKEEFHKLMATFKTADETLYDGVYNEPTGDRFETKAPIEALKSALAGQPFYVSDRIVEQKKEYPPSLFNLSGLQGHVTSKFKGWTSDKVLKVAQDLYEKKLITYPRTASLALEESLIDKTQKVLAVHKKGLPYENEIAFHTHKRVFDNSKVESHSAIMPTYMVAKGLTPDEKAVYDAVKNRFIMQFMPIAEHEEVTLNTKPVNDVEGFHAEGVFVSKGRTQLVEGWRKVEKIQSKEKLLPLVEKEDAVTLQKMKIDTKGTMPPKNHTEKTLLRVMETCGKRLKNAKKQDADDVTEDVDVDEDQDQDQVRLSDADVSLDQTEGIDVDALPSEEEEALLQAILSGFSIGTPATRAETITKLKRVGYIDTKGKSLFCTAMGRRLVETFPVKTLFDLEYTGRLEKTLSDISKGDVTKAVFLDTIINFTKDAVERIKQDAFHIIHEGEADKKPLGESLGKCPGCGSDVIEGEKGYGCTNWKGGCKFVVWKNDKFLSSLQVTPNKFTVMKLLEKGEVYSNSFTNKKGTKFSAYLKYEKDPQSGYYNWKMHF
jgi:DNA topoisomerase-3